MWRFVVTEDVCGLPQQGRSLKHFRLFKRISLTKTVASAGNIRKRNLKFKKYVSYSIEFYIFFGEPLKLSVSVILTLKDYRNNI